MITKTAYDTLRPGYDQRGYAPDYSMVLDRLAASMDPGTMVTLARKLGISPDKLDAYLTKYDVPPDDAQSVYNELSPTDRRMTSSIRKDEPMTWLPDVGYSKGATTAAGIAGGLAGGLAMLPHADPPALVGAGALTSAAALAYLVHKAQQAHMAQQNPIRAALRGE